MQQHLKKKKGYDIIVDWETNKLAIYHDHDSAIRALKKFRKTLVGNKNVIVSIRLKVKVIK